MVQRLESIAGLRRKIYPLRPDKNAVPPFCFFIQDTDSEDETLTGLTGLQHTGYKLHVVAEEYRALSLLCGTIRARLQSMQGVFYERSDNGLVGIMIVGSAMPQVNADQLFVERVRVMQSSPDLWESDVGWYRRIYDVDFDYQTERSEGT